jgi:hypothetical protein
MLCTLVAISQLLLLLSSEVLFHLICCLHGALSIELLLPLLPSSFVPMLRQSGLEMSVISGTIHVFLLGDSCLGKVTNKIFPVSYCYDYSLKGGAHAHF